MLPLFREEVPQFKWAICLIVGGVKMLARMVWGTCAVKIEVQMGICLIVGGSKSLPEWFGALITINTLI